MSEENKNIPEGEEEIETSAEQTDLLSDSAETTPVAPKKVRTVSLATFVCSAVALVLAAVMITYTACAGFYKKELAQAKLEGSQIVNISSDGKYNALEVLEFIFTNYSFQQLDDEQIKTAVMKAYVAATGDRYAEFFTEQEYEAFMSSIVGESVGIGVSVVNEFINVNGVEYNTIKIIQIFKDSPADASELQVGDRIAWIGSGDEIESVGELGYTLAVNKLRGEAGTNAEFKVIRADSHGEYFTKDISITRAKYEIETVSGKKIDGTNVGYVRIDSFDLVTPKQFTQIMDSLIEQGCEQFVYDVRNNPGGELRSIVSILTFFLEKGDTVITTESVSGYKEIYRAEEADYSGTDYADCTVTAGDIGKYSDFEKVVICNENTASAAELFTANFRDHELGKVVGSTTYGKGVAQSTMSLAGFGINGYLKFTGKLYYPPCGVNYDGEGITPDVEVELSDEAKQYSFYDLPIDKDDQLMEALECLK